MLQLESLAGLFFCSMRYSNLGSGISCLPFGAAPQRCPVAQAARLEPELCPCSTTGDQGVLPRLNRSRNSHRAKHRHSSLGFSRTADAIIDPFRQPRQQPNIFPFASCQLKPISPTMDSSTIKQTVMRQVQLESNTSNARMLIEVRRFARATPYITLRRLTQPARK